MDDRRLPFTEHLRELRVRLRNAVIALVVCTAATFYFAETLYALLARPLVDAFYAVKPDGRMKLHFESPIAPFWAYFKLSIYAGIFLASPVIFHQLWKFIAPGLYEKERRAAIPFAIGSALCFIGGAAFCYFLVFPATFEFFLGYSKENLGHVSTIFGSFNLSQPVEVEATIMMGPYLDLAVKLLLAFGLVFEMPMAIFFLSVVGLVTHRGLWRFNKYAIVLSFVIGALLTPGPDIMSQLLMALPMIVLYNLSISIAWIVTKRRERAATSDGGTTPS